MEVILMERVEHLGQMGDVVKVKPGFARNYLLPRGKALRATDDNKAKFEAQRAELEAANQAKREAAEADAGNIDGLMVTLIRQAGDMGQLYGSVNARDVATAAIEAGHQVARQQVELAHPIKTLGLFDVKVSLHPEVSVTVTANVARSEEEAKIQAETGKAVIAEEAEEVEEEAPAVEELMEPEAAAAAEEVAAEEAEADEAPTEEAGEEKEAE